MTVARSAGTSGRGRGQTNRKGADQGGATVDVVEKPAADRKALWQAQREAQAAKLAQQAAARRESGVSGRHIAAMALAEQQRGAQTASPPSKPAAQTAQLPSKPAAETAPPPSSPATGAAPVAAKEPAADRKALWQAQREAQAAKLAQQAAARRESGVSGRHIAAMALAEQQRGAQTAPPPSKPAAQTAPPPSKPAAQSAPPPSKPATGAAPVAANEPAADRKALWQAQREAQAAKLAQQAAARRESGVSGRHIAAMALAEQQRGAQTAPPPSKPAAQTAPPPSKPASGAAPVAAKEAAAGGKALWEKQREAQAAKLARQAAARSESAASGRRVAAQALAQQRRAATRAVTARGPQGQGLREAQAAKLARQAASRRESANSGRHRAAMALAKQQRGAGRAVTARQGQTEQAVGEGARRTGEAVDQAAGVAEGVINAASDTAEQAADSECLLHGA